MAPSKSRTGGFSLVELLLVLAIIGIISAVAIPSFLGQRKRARLIGDAISNSKSLAMMLESRKAETGLYGTSGEKATWTFDASTMKYTIDDNAKAWAPNFVPDKGSSHMSYTLVITNSGVGYTLTITAPEYGDGVAYKTDNTGAELERMK